MAAVYLSRPATQRIFSTTPMDWFDGLDVSNLCVYVLNLLDLSLLVSCRLKWMLVGYKVDLSISTLTTFLGPHRQYGGGIDLVDVYVGKR